MRGAGVLGEEGEAIPAVLTRGRWPFPKPRRPVLGGRGLPGAGVWHWGVRTADTVSTPPIGWFPGPVVQGFAPGTQPMGRAGEYSGCVVLCCVVLCCVVLCCVVLCCVVLCCVVLCCVVLCCVVLCCVVA